ncbi:unnamed protein product [Mesocestoides corti]|uniref:DUF3459 domain-containing protein n=1 Tax=Mesocestoides corti TaxID=53468 RepID=A0A0R3UFR8_MESCO|nr:unnamed protein product [Mesocestoides corti]
MIGSGPTRFSDRYPWKQYRDTHLHTETAIRHLEFSQGVCDEISATDPGHPDEWDELTHLASENGESQFVFQLLQLTGGYMGDPGLWTFGRVQSAAPASIIVTVPVS